MQKLKLPTQAELVELLNYDPLTGVFTWRKAVGSRIRPGAVAGNAYDRYIGIRIARKNYKAHRLAWMYIHGAEPKDQIDHINRNGFDNRIANLREATGLENRQNVGLSASNTSGLTGVGWNKWRNAWRAQIKTNYKTKLIGHFKTKEEAHQAYLKEKSSLHPFQMLSK